MVEELCSVLAIPTKVPVDPKPTLTVEIPIKLLLILAAKTTVPSSKVLIECQCLYPTSQIIQHQHLCYKLIDHQFLIHDL